MCLVFFKIQTLPVRIDRFDNFDLGGLGAALASFNASSAAFIPSWITLETTLDAFGVDDSADMAKVAPSVFKFLSFDLKIKGLVSAAHAKVDVNLDIPSLASFGVATLVSTFSISSFGFSSSTPGVLKSEVILGQTIGVHFWTKGDAESDSIRRGKIV